MAQLVHWVVAGAHVLNACNKKRGISCVRQQILNQKATPKHKFGSINEEMNKTRNIKAHWWCNKWMLWTCNTLHITSVINCLMSWHLSSASGPLTYQNWFIPKIDSYIGHKVLPGSSVGMMLKLNITTLSKFCTICIPKRIAISLWDIYTIALDVVIKQDFALYLWLMCCQWSFISCVSLPCCLPRGAENGRLEPL